MDQINSIKINSLMLYREIIAVCPKTHKKKHIYTLSAECRIFGFETWRSML